MQPNNFTTNFFGIGIQNGKTPENLGVLWRTAQNLGASFIFTIGKRYANQAVAGSIVLYDRGRNKPMQ